MTDDEKQLAQNAKTVQNLQLKLWAGTLMGLIVGVFVGAWVVLPALGADTWGGILGAFACIVAGAIAGQRIVLEMVSR